MNSTVIKKGDIIGNTVRGFRFQVIEVLFVMDNYFKVIVEDMSAFETFETTSDNMNFQDYKYIMHLR